MGSVKGQDREVTSAKSHMRSARRLPQARATLPVPPKVTEGGRGRPEQQPYGGGESSRKRGTRFLCGLNTGRGNYKGIGKK